MAYVFLRHVLSTQSPRIRVTAKWACVCACGLQELGVALDSIRINIRQTKSVHKKHCVLRRNSLKTDRVRLSPIKLTLLTDMNRGSVKTNQCREKEGVRGWHPLLMPKSELVSISACVSSTIRRSFAGSPLFASHSFRLSLSYRLPLSISFRSPILPPHSASFFFAFSLLLLWWHPLVSVCVCL